MPSPDRRRVVAVAYDGLCTFEFGIVVEIFGLPRPELGDDWYRFGVCSIEPGPLRATGGVEVRASPGLGPLRRAGTIVVPGRSTVRSALGGGPTPTRSTWRPSTSTHSPTAG